MLSQFRGYVILPAIPASRRLRSDLHMTRFPARSFLLFAVLLLVTAAASLQAQTRTVGVLKKEAGVSPGYTLFSLSLIHI